MARAKVWRAVNFLALVSDSRIDKFLQPTFTYNNVFDRPYCVLHCAVRAQSDIERIFPTDGPPFSAHITTAGVSPSRAAVRFRCPCAQSFRPLPFFPSRRPCHHGCQLRGSDACFGRANQVLQVFSALFCAPCTPIDLVNSSLPQDEVPFKLRCAICSKLAVNAFKTPCCEQMICENCKTSVFIAALACPPLTTRVGTSTLPTTCPVCEHTPVCVDDCKPNNKLRMTTRAFLKTAEKKRDTSQAKEATPATPLTPVDAKPSATPAPAPAAHEAAVGPTIAAAPENEPRADPTGPADQDAAPDAAGEDTEAPPAAEGEVRPENRSHPASYY